MDTGEQNLMGKPSQVIRFNKLTGQLEKPTILLKTRGGNTIDELQYTNLNLSFVGKGLDNLSFDVHKVVNGKECKCWDKIIDLCIIDYVGYGQFECNVTINDEDETIKSCVCESLETELGQHTIRDMHINDEDAIMYGRKVGNTNVDFDTGETSGKFIPTVLYNKNDQQHSLLDRVLAEKTPHWSVGYVSPQFAVNGYVYDADQIERTFTISGTTPYDFFDGEVSQEFNCVFTYDTYNRKVNCYNLDECVYNTTTNEIIEGYYRIDGIYYDENDNIITDTSNLGYCSGIGQDTTIFMSKSKLANSFSIDSDKDSVKNCFYVSGGDDVITNIVGAANVTGDNYIYMFGNFQYEDMSQELVDKIKSYATLLSEKEEEFNKVGGVYVYDSEGKYRYNEDKQRVEDKNGRIIVTSKYVDDRIYVLDTLAYYENGTAYNKDCEVLSSSDYIYDEAGLYTEYTSLVDRINYWEHTRFPDVIPSDTTAEDEMQKIISYFSSRQVYIRNGCTDDSFAHVTSVIETLLGIVCDSRYTIKIFRDNDHTLSCTTIDKDHIHGNWNGVVYIKRTTNETDYVEFDLGANITLSNDIDSDINFCKQNMDIAIAKLDIKELDFTKLTDEELRELLKEYNLNSLKSFRDGFDSCRATLNDLLANMELEKAEVVRFEDDAMLLSLDRYNDRYDIANELYEELFGYVESLKSQQEIFETDIKNFRAELDMKTFFGESLWKEFRSYVREDEYNNPNYISDGLTNCEILEKAKELLEVAKKELSKACVIQKTISGDINNIFSLEEKETLHDKFALFNYVRVRADDNIYKLRLMEISFSEDSPEKLNVTFSEQIEDVSGKKSDVQKILEQSQSIATTYSSTTKKAKQGASAMSNFNTLKQEGLDSSLYLIKNSNTEEVTFGNTGLSCKSMLDQGIYSPYEVRVTHNGIYMSENNFNSVKTALGRFKYNNEWVYGLCTDVLFGDLIIGEKMLISNKNGSVSITGDGIVLDGGSITWTTNIDASNINSKGSTLDEVISDYDDSIIEITNNINELDDRVQTYSQSEDPSKSWKSNEYEYHLGDVWFDTANNLTKIWTKNGDNYEWAITEDANLKALATQKSTIYRTTSAPNRTTYPELKSGDLWVLPADTVVGDNTYKKDTILIYNGSSWTTTTTDSAENALSQLSDIANDGKITPSEKVQLKFTVLDIKSEYASIISECNKYDNVSYTNLATAYNNLVNNVGDPNPTSGNATGIFANMNVTSDVVSSTFIGYFSTFYSSRDEVLKLLEDARKEYSVKTSKSEIVAFQKNVLGATSTDITSKHVISPYLGGGYLYISQEGRGSVEINPEGITSAGAPGNIFSIKNSSGNEVIGMDTNGNATFEGNITATSLTLKTGVTIPSTKIDGLKNISSSKTQYQVGNSGTTAPTGTWLDTVPTIGEGQYLWTKVTLVYTDKSTEYYYTVGYQGVNGINGDNGISVTSVTPLYYLKSNQTAPSAPTSKVTSSSVSSGVWTTAIPTYIKNYYYFTCTQIEYSSGNPTFTPVILDNGTNSAIIQSFTTASDLAAYKKEISGKNYVASADVKILETTTNNGITTQKIQVGSQQFDYVDTGDFICTDIGIGTPHTVNDKTTGNQKYVVISKEGLLTADNAIIRGSIYATNGYFSGELKAATGSFTGSINVNNRFIVDELGNVTLPAGTKISWTDVTGTDNIATQSFVTSQGYQTASQVTSITEDTISTTNVTATNLHVKSANIDGQLVASQINTNGLIAENISGTTIIGKTITGSTVSGGTISGSTIESNNITCVNKLYTRWDNGTGVQYGKTLILNATDLGHYDMFTSDDFITCKGRWDFLSKTYMSSSLDVSGRTTVGSLQVLDRVVSTSSANCRWTTGDSSGVIRQASGSSRRYKHDITQELKQELLPERLYDLNIYQYKYNADYLAADDIRYMKDVIGFIAEDVYEKYPIAADYHIDENGNPIIDDWVDRFIIPPMLALIQKQHKQLELQQQQIDSLQSTLNRVLEELQQLKQNN